MSKLYLYNYNNYFNRIVKRETSLANYGTPIYSLDSTNFNYNDGVETYHDINYAGFDGNYLIVTDDNNNIVSRWFIKENKRLRGGQHRITLRRDLIVDNYDKIITAPALIYRGMINNPNDPLLFNSEGFSFNQIKVNELKLNDKTATPWYILYFAKNTPAKSISIVTSDTTDYDFEINSLIEDSIYKSGEYQVLDNTLITIDSIIDFNAFKLLNDLFEYIVYTKSGPYYGDTTGIFSGAADYIWFEQDLETVKTELNNVFTNSAVRNTINNKIKSVMQFTDTITLSNLNSLKELNGKKVKDSSGKVYLLNISYNEEIERHWSQQNPDDEVSEYLKQLINSTSLTRTGNWGDKAFSYQGTKKYLTIDTTLIDTPQTITFNFEFTSKQNTVDANYNIIAIPRDDIIVHYPLPNDDYNWVECLKGINERLINELIAQYGNTYIYDIQISPYFPYMNIPNITDEFHDNDITLQNAKLNSNKYQYLTDGTNGSIIFYLESSNTTFDIEVEDTDDYKVFDTNNEVLNKKIQNECYVYRLCSPNYNGVFEFSPAKNNGVNKFNVDITFKPYNLYLHINPDFKGLYGSDFDDNRGLICGGDFSLPIMSSQFTEYELRNKNYQLAFDRQIQHMDFEFSKQRTEALFGATMGAVGGAMSGAVGGSVIGGPLGAGAGALIGGVASAVGGAIDYTILKERQAEQKDLTLDMFEYQLGNIKALPYNLNKITPINFNFKDYPFIEIYKASDREINVLIDKIKYNSMTINAIGNIASYIQTEKKYISASLIRLEDLDMPTHEANEIYDEILKGVYI